MSAKRFWQTWRFLGHCFLATVDQALAGNALFSLVGHVGRVGQDGQIVFVGLLEQCVAGAATWRRFASCHLRRPDGAKSYLAHPLRSFSRRRSALSLCFQLSMN
jgi:hypothetical protein